MANKIAIMLDGGHLRVHARKAGKAFDPDYMEKIGLACSIATETIHRIMYYDCATEAPSNQSPASAGFSMEAMNGSRGSPTKTSSAFVWEC